jgi:hypothetical protein
MSQQRRRRLFTIGAFCTIALLSAALPGATLAADDRDHDATLVGTWRESIIFPGVPIEFFDLVAFHEDGTVTERFDSGPALSGSIGVWKKVGHGTFAVLMENYEDIDLDGTFDVRYRLRLTYHVVDRDTLMATGTSDTLSIDGTTQLSPPFTGVTIRATRMRVIPE